MQSRLLPRRSAATTLALLVAVAALTGCHPHHGHHGHGHGHGHHYKGSLAVVNSPSSYEAIVQIELSAVNGSSQAVYDTHLHPGDSVTFEEDADLYDVIVHWSDGGFESFFDVRVNANDLTFVRAVR